jgi:Mn2+/Fe2+ NRAMP family transporter
MFGVALGFTRIDPIKALFFAAVINGIVSAPIMVIMMRMASNPKIMGQFVVTRRLKLLGWSATAVMALAVVAMLVQSVD